MRVHAVPQWQGAGWAGAEERLPLGCQVLASLTEDLLGLPVERVPVGWGGSPVVDGVAHRSALVDNRTPQLTALENPEGPVLTLGGDCAADLVPVGVARFRYGADLTVLWFDAHADCNSARSSPSGAFHGMVLRSLLGEGDPDFVADPALSPGRAVLVGTRAFDPAERAVVESGLVRYVPAPAEPAVVVTALREARAGSVYVHLDVDVLDPTEFAATHYHEPGGLTIDGLVACLDGLAEFDVVGAAVTECAAAERSEVEPLAPVIEALHRRLAP